MIITDQEKHRSTEEAILRTIKTLHDGSVEIVVQDSKVIRLNVQFSKTRKAKSKDASVSVSVWP
jgi:hypothetical protein